MASVAEKLRRERLNQGIDLATLAQTTRINQKYLEAIERGDSAGLPGGFFYRSFVRQYAIALGMEPGEMEKELDREREAEAPKLSAALEKAVFPLKTPDPIVIETNRTIASGRTISYVLLLVGVLAGCSAFYTWWRNLESRSTAEAAPASIHSAQQKAPAAPTATAVPVQPAAARVTELPGNASGEKVYVIVAAREATWLSITSDGKAVFSGVLEPQQTKVLDGREQARIRVGNAAGLEITWNGKPIPKLGSRGQVRTVLFTPENYQILPVGGSL